MLFRMYKLNFLFMILLQLWGLGTSVKEGSVLGSVVDGSKSAILTGVKSIEDRFKRIPALFSNCVVPPPVCPSDEVTFWYYSREKPDTPVKLNFSDPQSFTNLPRNKNPWKIIIHGYTKSKDEIPNPQLRSAYFKRGDYNLISVDYNPIALEPCYVQAVQNVPLIANCTAQIINALIEKNYFFTKNLHVIGFSLGGQIAGQIHKYLKHGKPGRVTGLDPAGPLFAGIINDKLGPDAGEFVDVVHTNALAKGKLERSGNVDFYVNGGLTQPGCKNDDDSTLSTCSHNRSPLYFAESINSASGFWGIPCNNYIEFYAGQCNTEDKNLVLMGEDVPHTARGTYFLETTSKEPFAVGKRTKVASKL